MKQEITEEIYKLHEYFQGWYNGLIGKDELQQKIGNRLSEKFSIVYPDATRQYKEDFLNMLQQDYGNDENFKIEIKDVKIDILSKSIFLIKYEEWQYWDKIKSPKLKICTTTVLEEQANEIKWISIHETEIKDSH